MKSVKKISSFLILAMFLFSNLPVRQAVSAEGGGTDVFPEAEFYAWVNDSRVETLVTRSEGETWDGVAEMNLEFENENGTKVIIPQSIEGGVAEAITPVKTFVEGGLYRLKRVFGRLIPDAEYSFTAEAIGKEAEFELNRVDMSKITLKNISKPVKYGDIVTLEAFTGEGLELVDKIVVEYFGQNHYWGFIYSNRMYTLSKDADGRFKSDIYIHKYMPVGENCVYSITAFDAQGEKLGYLEHMDGRDFEHASIHIEEEQSLNLVDLELVSQNSTYQLGETPELSIEHSMEELEYLSMQGNILLKNLDSDAVEAYVTFEWDQEQQDFVIQSLIGLENGNSIGHLDSMKPGRYVSTGILFGWRVTGTETPDIINTDQSVLFTVEDTIEEDGFIFDEVKFPKEFIPGKEHTLSIKIEDTKKRDLGDVKFIFSPLSTVGSRGLELLFKNTGDGWFTATYTPEFYTSPKFEDPLVMISENLNGTTVLHSMQHPGFSERYALNLGNGFGAEALDLKLSVNKDAFAVGEYIKFSFSMNKWEEKLNYATDRFGRPEKSYAVIRHLHMDAEKSLYYARIMKDMKSGEFKVDSSKLNLPVGEYRIEAVIFAAIEVSDFEEYYSSHVIEITPLEFTVDGSLPVIKETVPQLSEKEDLLSTVIIPEASMENVEKVDLSLQVEDVVVSSEITEKMNAYGHIFMVSGIKLMKNITYKDGTENSAVVDNADIKGDITLRMPVPVDFDFNLKPLVIYINEKGELEEKETWMEKDGEEWFIYFKTDHFSTYALLGVSEELTEEVPEEEDPEVEDPEEEDPEVEEPLEEDPEEDNTEEEKPVVQDPEKEEPVEDKIPEAEEEKTEEKLPQTGAGTAAVFSLSGILFTGAGIVLLKKKKLTK
ncbi:LPXTG cell wall anchor domain-containing protein [Proteiniclasticum ruminis]|uniref:LPXTG cell wall anchor domain-containing protein n=1 Tax=Proteiniclasticum ruminis TaxID=398199 RepID=UPI0028ADA721|nr:LPXTG cell wall anchor domain-containing protein [Proteiniclasticum ruminis]